MARKKKVNEVIVYAVQTFKDNGVLLYQNISENYKIALIEKECQQKVFTGLFTTIEKYKIRLPLLTEDANAKKE